MANRDNIYYWKCDRPLAFYAINKKCDTNIIVESLKDLLTEFFHDDFTLCPACGQGNHLTYLAEEKGKKYFIRIEDGPECDDYMEVEAYVMKQVRKVGVPTPEIYAVDSSRRKYPFAYQIMENLNYDDLNKIYQRNDLDTDRVMHKLGSFVAAWQSIAGNGFGLFNSERLRSTGELVGLHNTYEAYYRLNLSKHLDFLTKNEFLTEKNVQEIISLIDQHQSLLQISHGCLVHKDLALWNVLGSKTDISSVIDWDDSILGDPTDDLSLMACFHSGKELTSLLEGYQEVKELPENFEKRFWLHLLRNIIFKAVIRVGAGYFKKSSDFFLVNKENNLKTTTQDRIFKAIEGLKGNIKISDI